jgi:hypothetical protein
MALTGICMLQYAQHLLNLHKNGSIGAKLAPLPKKISWQ